MRIDAHTHTNYSHDCLMPLRTLKAKYARMRIIPIITDHNRFLGAERYSRIAQCIKGLEIGTRDGEIIGIFLHKPVRPHLPLERTLDLIHSQGGLAIAPHPFDRLRRKRIPHVMLKRLIRKIDIIEVFNSRTVFQEDNICAEEFAREHHKPMIVGSDSHTWMEVGRSYVDMPAFKSPREFLKNLSKAKLVRHRSPIIAHVFTKSLKFLRGIR